MHAACPRLPMEGLLAKKTTAMERNAPADADLKRWRC